ncbi:carbon-nitrogen hydrolase family protein [Salinibacterium sp. NK8237]|uniref:carbon-nitrogen hydrolase family protein n=1 Tax=Salinibacterium sp. NK8237 TaxID=2792038 RepID=UPI0018CF5A69|nr:carbon-nitrogen hydrolase family protein [Salinibacterium sp. NK8237]MBH0130639.1 carbon-nitrogen hydrolase family protein [Salinibacterium sp. NK8237]
MSSLPQSVPSVRVAAAQFFSGPDVEENLEIVKGYMREAAAAGVQVLVVPENSNRVRDYKDRAECYDKCESLDGAFVTGIQAAARELGVMIAVGVDLRGEQSPDVNIASVLIDTMGKILHVHHKTVFWDYEYTLFTPGTKQVEVVDTQFGRVGLLLCADGIVPEVPRILALKGADMLLNSLNSRGPDEMRVHEPLRAIENHVWHVAANTVGGPANGFPWTGGSQVVSPLGDILANAGETEERMVWADITPSTSHPKRLRDIGDLTAFRRPELYGELRADIDSHAGAAMYGPVADDAEPRIIRSATLQTSWYHSTEWTLSRAVTQVGYAAIKGARLGVFPELFIHSKGSIEADPGAAAALAEEMLDALCTAAAQHSVWIVANLVEQEGDRYYSTAYLIGDDGHIFSTYRKVHLSETERAWATPGDTFVVADTPVGRIGLMIGNEVWLPEITRILSLRGAEIIAHPTSWDRLEAATQAATERTEENRVHLISTARTDNAAGYGSQIVVADRFIFGQPVALMRYPTAYTSRTGFEEDMFIDLDLTDSHSKMQGYHLDPLATRQPHLYDVLVDTTEEIAHP